MKSKKSKAKHYKNMMSGKERKGNDRKASREAKRIARKHEPTKPIIPMNELVKLMGGDKESYDKIFKGR